jgi:hypothetical protein
MADSLPPSSATVRVGVNGSSALRPNRPPPGAISFPPPLSPQAQAAAASSPNSDIRSPGSLTPATQFTFRKGVHLPAIKSPPKVPSEVGAAASSDDASPASHAVASSPVKGSALELAGNAVGSRAVGVDGEEEDSLAGRVKPTVRKKQIRQFSTPNVEMVSSFECGSCIFYLIHSYIMLNLHFVLFLCGLTCPIPPQASGKVAPGPTSPGPEFMSPSSSEWAEWHAKQSGESGAASSGSAGNKSSVLSPVRSPSVSQGQAIIELGSFDSERTAKKRVPAAEDELTLAEKHAAHRKKIWLTVAGVGAVFLGLLIAFGYFWGNNPEHYVSDEQVKTVAAETVAAAKLQSSTNNNTTIITQLGSRSVIGEYIALDTITDENMADGSIGSSSLIDGSVTADKLDTTSVSDFMLDVISGAGLFTNVTAITSKANFGLTASKDISFTSGKNNGVTIAAGVGGLTIDTLHTGSSGGRTDFPGSTSIRTDGLSIAASSTALTTDGFSITASQTSINTDGLSITSSLMSVSAPVQSVISTIVLTGLTNYVIDFANLPSSSLRFTGSVSGPINVTVVNCNAAYAGIELRLLNTLTATGSDAALLSFSRDTCSGVFNSTVASGSSNTIECVGPLPNAPTDQLSTRVLCTRAVGSAAGVSDFKASGTIGLTDVVSGVVTVNPGSVKINATAGVVSLTLTSRDDIHRQWGSGTAVGTYSKASFWLYNSLVTSAHAGVQLTVLQAGSAPSANSNGGGLAGGDGAFTINKQHLVPGVGILITVTNVGTTYPGEILTYLFSLI